MEDQNIFVKSFLTAIETFFSMVVDGELTDKLLFIIILLAAALWIYSGIKLFLDARKRYDINPFLQAVIFILGIITGPIGFLFYLLTRPKYTMDEVDFLKTEHKFYFQNASKVVECINCAVYVPEDHEYCSNCGEQNRIKCQNCNVLTNLDDKFCYKCGYKFDEERKDTILKNLESRTLFNIESSEGHSKKPIIPAINFSEGIKKSTEYVGDVANNFKDLIKGFNASMVNLHLKSKDGTLHSEAQADQVVQDDLIKDEILEEADVISPKEDQKKGVAKLSNKKSKVKKANKVKTRV